MKAIDLFDARQQGAINSLALLLLRLTFGGLMLIDHGWPKMMILFGDGPVEFPDPLGIGVTPSLILAVFSEVLCALLVMIGLFTRLASIPLIITMAVAFFIVHSVDPLGAKEMSLIYLMAYIVILLMGAGRFAVDAAISKS